MNDGLCEVAGCTNALTIARRVDGVRMMLCGTHHSRLARNGTIDAELPVLPRPRKPEGLSTCQLPGCVKGSAHNLIGVAQPHGRIYVCRMHYARMYTRGSFDAR